MPTIPQLPPAAEVTDTDAIPVSQDGVARAVSVGTLLDGTQPALTLATGTLLGRVSSGPGGPEPVALGSGLTLTNDVLSATALTDSSVPTLTTLAPEAAVVANSGGQTSLLPLTVLRGMYSAGENVTISQAGVISAQTPPAVSLGAVTVGPGLSVGTSGALAVTFGAAANTATQGNDPRVVGAEQTANKSQPNGYAALDSNGRVAISQLSGADLSGADATAPFSGTVTRSLAARFGDVVNINDFGLARDGVTDDSARFIAATQAAMARRGCLYIPTGGPILLTDAAQQNVRDVAIIGDGLRDIDANGYGTTGSQLWFTGTTNSPFLLGGAVRFDGINFFWPSQTEAATVNNGNAPIAYPPLFGQQNPPQQVNRFDFINCQVTNCYDFLTDTGTSGNQVLGALNIDRCHIYAIRNCFTLQFTPEVMFFSNTLFSWGTYGNVVDSGPTYNLRTFTQTQGCWLKVVGDGTPTQFPSTQVEGVTATNCYVLGPAKGIWCAAGCLGLSNLVNTSFDNVPVVLQVDPGGSTQSLRFTGGAWYPIYAAGGIDTTAIVINNPSPSTPGLNLSMSGVNIPFIDGSLASINGANVALVSIADVRCPALGHTYGGKGPYYGLQINAPNAYVRVSSCDFAPADSGVSNTAVQLTAVDVATLTDNTFYGFTAPIDIETTAGAITLNGNTAVATQGATSIIGTGTTNVYDNGNNWDKQTFAYRGFDPNIYRQGGNIGLIPVAGSVASPYVGLSPTAGAPDVRLGLTGIGNGVVSITTNSFTEEVLRIDRVAGAVNGVGIAGAVSGGTVYVVSMGADASIPLQLNAQGGGPVRVGSAGSSGSPAVFPGAQADQSYVVSAPANGFTQTIPGNCSDIVLNPSGSLGSGSLTMPAAPVDGQRVTVATTQTISALNVVGNAGQSVRAGSGLALAANSSASWQWIAGLATWIRK
ncbi:MAG: hypothetical protein JO264_13240 [Acidisphaera sp.]|nr:hypothetical protein [Acidisphaera sp.]